MEYFTVFLLILFIVLAIVLYWLYSSGALGCIAGCFKELVTGGVGGEPREAIIEQMRDMLTRNRQMVIDQIPPDLINRRELLDMVDKKYGEGFEYVETLKDTSNVIVPEWEDFLNDKLIEMNRGIFERMQMPASGLPPARRPGSRDDRIDLIMDFLNGRLNAIIRRIQDAKPVNLRDLIDKARFEYTKGFDEANELRSNDRDILIDLESAITDFADEVDKGILVQMQQAAPGPSPPRPPVVSTGKPPNSPPPFDNSDICREAKKMTDDHLELTNSWIRRNCTSNPDDVFNLTRKKHDEVYKAIRERCANSSNTISPGWKDELEKRFEEIKRDLRRLCKKIEPPAGPPAPPPAGLPPAVPPPAGLPPAVPPPAGLPPAVPPPAGPPPAGGPAPPPAGGPAPPPAGGPAPPAAAPARPPAAAAAPAPAVGWVGRLWGRLCGGPAAAPAVPVPAPPRAPVAPAPPRAPVAPAPPPAIPRDRLGMITGPSSPFNIHSISLQDIDARPSSRGTSTSFM